MSISRIPRENLHSRSDKKDHSISLDFIQNAIKENNLLKERIKLLELQQSKCDEFHAQAETAAQMMQTANEENLKKANKIIEEMNTKHQLEIIQYVNERVAVERRLTGDIIQLKCVIDKLKKKVEVKEAVILENSNQERIILELTRELENTKRENSHLKLTIERLKELKDDRLIEAVIRIDELKEENVALLDDIVGLQQVNLEYKLKIETLERELHNARNVDDDLMDTMRDKLVTVVTENRDLNQKGEEYESVINGLSEDKCAMKKDLQTLKNRVKFLETITMEKDNSLCELGMEMEELRKKASKCTETKGDSKFRDFVELKREVETLKEQNHRLQRKMGCDSDLHVASDAGSKLGHFMTATDRSTSLDQIRPRAKNKTVLDKYQ